jgi:RNA polymerase sigma-70 factor, ECF subfamily
MSTVRLNVVTREPLTEGLDRIFREHYQLVYRTAFGVVGSREDAQDVVQSVFLQLLRREFPEGLNKNPKAYLYRAVVNTALNAVRSRKRYVLSNDPEIFEATHSSEPDSGEELHRRLYLAIAELSPETAHILILRYLHEYSIADIAKLLGKSRGVIAVTLFRTRARLKQLMSVSQEGEL